MKKILIAEDDPFLLKVYEAKMKKLNLEVQLAKDGEAVFKILESFKPDLILLDLVMPKKDGFEVLAEMQANPSYKNIPVIVTSNLGQPEDKTKAEKFGVKGYLVKSDTPISEIIAKVESFLK